MCLDKEQVCRVRGKCSLRERKCQRDVEQERQKTFKVYSRWRGRHGGRVLKGC